jgi:uncharacterized protein YqjF (DUF2071 family)
MLNYEVDPDALTPFVPRGTELDVWQGRHYVSIVAFRFLHTLVRGIPIPFHRNFDEINFRFYVGRDTPDGWRRGVVFIKEVVPRWAIAAVARWVYNENYVACPTNSSIRLPHGEGAGSVRFSWSPRGMDGFGACVKLTGQPAALTEGSEAEFITEHFWGYAAQRDGSTVEYEVEHPSWRIWPGLEPELTGPVGGFYGPRFVEALSQPPRSAFVADGSAVIVRQGRRLPRTNVARSL